MSRLLHIRLLGSFGLVRGDEPITTVTAPRLRSLVAYLALRCEAPQPRDHLAFIFWPDSTEKQALTNLRHVLHRLREAFPEADQVLDADAQTLQLKSGACRLDVDDFRDAVQQADASRKRDDRPQELQHLLRATDLYRGDLLPSCYEEWIEEDRRRLRQEHGATLDAVIQLLEARREYAAAIRFARRRLQHEPLREPTYRTLMRLHALAGDRAGVLQSYDECREMLEREFASTPAESTEALHRQLLDGQSAVPVPSAVAGGEHPLIGRFREWEQLKNAWRRAREEGIRLVAVTGEAGIGKTRLLDELLAWVRQQGFPTARTRSYAAEGRLAYAPIAEWLRSDALRPGLDDLDDVWLGEIARILPEIRSQRADLPEVEPTSDEWNRRRLFDALCRAISVGRVPRGSSLESLRAPSRDAGSTRATPLLLVLDDLQWTDHPTLEWIRYLLQHAHDIPLLLGTTIRTEEIEPDLEALLVDLRIDGQLEEIALGALTADESAAVARQVGSRALEHKEVTRLQEETEGNPLFIVETIRMQMLGEEQGADRRTSGGFAGDGAAALPPKVHAVIVRRLRQLSREAAETAALAAVMGRSFSAEILTRAGRRTEEALAATLDELWRRRIIEEESLGRYDFTHDKLREVAYADLSPERRRLLHLSIARALETSSSEDESTTLHVATHYEHAGRYTEAAEFYRRAADAARLVYASREAARLYRRAIALLDRASTPDRARLELPIQTALGACLVAIEGYTALEVRQAYERAQTLCLELGVPADAPILRGIALSNISGGDLDEARRLGGELRDVAEKEEDPVMAVEGRYVLGVTAFWQGRFASSRDHLEAALERYDPVRRRIHTSLYAQDPGLVCRCRLALTLWYLGEEDRARRLLDEAFEEARVLGHPQTSAYVLCFGTHLILDAQEYERARSLTREAHQLAEKHDLTMWRELANIHQGWARAELGELRDGVDQMRMAVAEYRRIGNVLLAPQYLAVLGDLHRRMDAPEKARAALQEAFEFLEDRGERYYEAELYRLRGELLREHSPKEARRAFRRSLAIAREKGTHFLESRAASSLARLGERPS